MSENYVVAAGESGIGWSGWRWFATAAVLVLLACGAVLVVSRAIYNEWPWSAYPTGLHTCGRNYIDEGARTRTQIEANGDRLTRVGSVPGWLNHGELWTTSVGEPIPGGVCHVVMWVRTGTNTYESYSLSGGP
jgi:hypothetical protein